MSPEIIIAVVAAAAVLLVTYGIAARPSEDAVQARLSQLVVQARTVEEMELQQPFYERVMRPMIQRLARAGRRQEGGLIQRIDAKLEKAGYPGGLRGADWVGVKLMALIGFAVLLLVLGLLLFLISPTYILPMFEKPPEMFGLPLGVVFFAVGLISMGLGYILIRRIVDIKV